MKPPTNEQIVEVRAEAVKQGWVTDVGKLHGMLASALGATHHLHAQIETERKKRKRLRDHFAKLLVDLETMKAGLVQTDVELVDRIIDVVKDSLRDAERGKF